MGVPEKIIQDQTSHKSLDALHTYDQTIRNIKQFHNFSLQVAANTTDQFLPTDQFSHSSHNLNIGKTSAISFHSIHQCCTIKILRNSAPNTSIGNLTDKEFQGFNEKMIETGY